MELRKFLFARPSSFDRVSAPKMVKAIRLPSRAILQSLLQYDPATGELSWRYREIDQEKPLSGQKSFNNRFAGKPAGWVMPKSGYVRLLLKGRRYLAHRVIWKMMTGEEPEQVDHENGDRLDNRWENLRAADNSINMRNQRIPKNNTSGHMGVKFNENPNQAKTYSGGKRWEAVISINGKQKRIGRYHTKEEAVAARKAAEKVLNYHPNHGRD